MKYHIKDESGDRKYFTQIPNMIVNHSTAYEQSLYLIMKRLAGENGTCYASQNYLAEKMGIDKRTVSKTISKLLKRKWVAEISPMKVRGGKVRQFTIIDLWKINLKEYELVVKCNTSEVVALCPEVVVKGTSGGGKMDTKKNYKEDILRRGSSFNKKKPYYRGMEMRFSKGKWWCLPEDGSEWLEFAGEKSEIEHH